MSHILNCCSRTCGGAISMLSQYFSICHIGFSAALGTAAMVGLLALGCDLTTSAKISLTTGLGHYLLAPITGCARRGCAND